MTDMKDRIEDILAQMEDYDISKSMPLMQSHKFMAMPDQVVPLKVDGIELQFMFELCYRVRNAMLSSLNSPNISSDEYQEAAIIADQCEDLYMKILSQLKVNSVTTTVAH